MASLEATYFKTSAGRRVNFVVEDYIPYFRTDAKALANAVVNAYSSSS